MGTFRLAVRLGFALAALLAIGGIGERASALALSPPVSSASITPFAVDPKFEFDAPKFEAPDDPSEPTVPGIVRLLAFALACLGGAAALSRASSRRKGTPPSKASAPPTEHNSATQADDPKPTVAKSIGEPIEWEHATAEDLAALPGITPALGLQLVALREQGRGPKTLEDLATFTDVKPHELAAIRRRVIFPDVRPAFRAKGRLVDY